MVFGLSVRASEIPSCSLVSEKQPTSRSASIWSGWWILRRPRDDREEGITSPYLSQETPIWSFSAKRTASDKKIDAGLFTFGFCWLRCWCLHFQAFFSKRLETSFVSLFLFHFSWQDWFFRLSCSLYVSGLLRGQATSSRATLGLLGITG